MEHDINQAIDELSKRQAKQEKTERGGCGCECFECSLDDEDLEALKAYQRDGGWGLKK